MTRRAELESLTRLRITESVVHLHGTVGPRRTTISAVAEHAGVRRSTVYRHFADEAALFAACTSHWMAANPLPDLERWAAITDPDERLAFALGELYPHYRQTEGMMDNLVRDEPLMPIVRDLFQGYRDYLAGARGVLTRGRSTGGTAVERTTAAVGHALAYSTWHSLVREQGLDDSTAVSLMCRLVARA
jgi:AcrR family transcriptional regulator